MINSARRNNQEIEATLQLEVNRKTNQMQGTRGQQQKPRGKAQVGRVRAANLCERNLPY